MKNDSTIQVYMGLLAYISLFVLALLFFKERTLWGDIPYHVFHIIGQNDFAIQNSRFGAIITQWVPLLMARLKFDPITILMAYSGIFILVHGLVFTICHFILKEKKTAQVMFFFTFLITTHTFYWIQSEYPQGIAIMLLYMAYLSRVAKYKQTNWYEWPIHLLATSVIAYFHPLIFIPYLFILLFLYIDQPQRAGKSKMMYSLGIFALIFSLKNTLFKVESAYESSLTVKLNRFIDYFPNYVDIDYNHYFIDYCIANYYFLPIFLLTCIVFYLKNRQFKKLGLVLSFFLGNLLLVNVVFNQSDFVAYYMENMYLPLVLYVAFPIAYDILPTFHKWIRYLLYTLVPIMMIGRVTTVNTSYSEKIAWQEAFMKKTSSDASQKLIVDKLDTPYHLIKGSEWSSSYEYWLISILNDISNPRSILVHHNTRQWKDLERLYNRHFITEWGFFDYSLFKNPYYFQFSDTSYYKIYTIDSSSTLNPLPNE